MKTTLIVDMPASSVARDMIPIIVRAPKRWAGVGFLFRILVSQWT
jgi:hypothetical protein